jgi:hypothetical protein
MIFFTFVLCNSSVIHKQIPQCCTCCRGVITLSHYFPLYFDRYVAIVHPIKAHILCSRRRILLAVSTIWPVACICGLPIALYNQVISPRGFSVDLCVLLLPSKDKTGLMAFKLAEFALYFLGPVVIQVRYQSIY